MEEINQASLNSDTVDAPIEISDAIEQKEKEITSVEDDVDKDNPIEKTNDEDSDDEDSDDSNERFPKKAERALERRNKKINKLRLEKAELEQMLMQYTQEKEQVNNTQNEGLREPREEDFEDYAEYWEARGAFKVKKEYADREQEYMHRNEQESQQKWFRDRAAYVDERAAKAVESIPELNGLYSENQDIIEGYTDATKIAFLESEKPELAFYALASEGRLEELDLMSPYKLAREIALAEIRGEKMSKTRPQSNAPAPINKPKSSGVKRKMLDDMSPKELLAHLKQSKK